MRSAKSTARIIGMLLVVQLAGLIVPFILLHPLGRSPDFMANAAASSSQIKLAVILLFINGAITISIAIAALPVFRGRNHAMAMWLLALSIIWFVMQAVDNSHVLSMVSLSQEYTKVGAANADLFQALAGVVGSGRKWAHYTELLVIDAWMFVFYGLLWRSRLVPRELVAFGLLTVVLHTTGISLPLFLGYRGVTLMGATMAVSNVAMALWLIVKGFEDHEARRDTIREDAMATK